MTAKAKPAPRISYDNFALPPGYEPWHLCLTKFGLGKGEEKLKWFKRLVTELWPEPLFMWDRWSDLFFGALCGAKETVEQTIGAKIESDYPWWEQLTATGAAGCIDANTRILDPTTGESPTVEQRYKSGKPSWVMTLGGPILADVPFIKGTAELFEVLLDDGSKFTATANHRVLTPDGYRFVSELSVGSTLTGYALSYPQTTLGIAPLVQKVDYAVRSRLVQAITGVGSRIYYDLTVPEQHHYFAEGAIHHNTGKSSRAALWVLCNWLCAREHTTCMLTSTSVTALKQRIWSELVDWIQKCKQPLSDPTIGWLQIVPSDTIIRWSGEDTKSAIFGRAVDQGGSVDNAVGRIKGIHNRRVFVVTDEMTAMPEAIAKACRNLDSGTMEFQFIGLGNATDYSDQHGIYCEPVDGWNSVTVNDEFWLTKLGGCCVHLDGHKSPSLDNPAKYHFYIGRKKLEKDARFFGGENTPDYWRECRGFWAPSGLSTTVMDAFLLSQFNTADKAVWKARWEMGAGFDVAFEGGDRRVLYPFKFGEFASGVKGIEFQAPVIVNIDMTQDKRFIHYGIAAAVEETCRNYKIDGKPHPILPHNLACDVTGEGAGPFGIMSGSWSRDIIPVEFGGAAEKTAVSADRPTTWHELYGNKVTEIWYSMRRFIEGGQVRGLTDADTIRELTSRDYVRKNNKTHVLPKSEMKKLKSRSPDLADAACIAAFVLRKKGIMPASVADNVVIDSSAWNAAAEKMNMEGNESDYEDSTSAFAI